MSIDDAGALEALLMRMRTLHDSLAEHDAGLCVLHLDAAIAALESRLRRGVGREAVPAWAASAESPVLQ